MPRYYFEAMIRFAGEIEADDEDKAREMWEEELDLTTLHYAGTESEYVEELDDDDDED